METFLFNFQDLYFNDLKNQYEKFPICPFKDCPSMFNNKNLVEEHYKHTHKESILDWPNSNFINKCQTCYQGPFLTFEDLLKHLSVQHEASVETYIKRLGLPPLYMDLTSDDEVTDEDDDDNTDSDYKENSEDENNSTENDDDDSQDTIVLDTDESTDSRENQHLKKKEG